MKVAGLFAGIGGLEHGLAAAGHESVLLSEIWPPAQAVLSKRFPGIPNVGDVARIDSLPAEVDLVTAGFPCQDLSQAGRTEGISGRRSGLVDHVFRLIDESRPASVLLENVSFMLRLDGGSAMSRLVSAFEERGYRWAYRVVNSLAFLPQRRERVYFLASRTLDPADVLFADDVEPPRLETTLDTHAHGFYWTEGTRGLGWGPDCVPTLKNGSTVGIPSPPAILMPSGEIVTPDIRDAERLQGFVPDWTKPAEAVGRASFRWALVGNAVSVPVAAWIGRRLDCRERHDRDRDRDLSPVAKWPRSARFDGVRRFEVAISDFPQWVQRPALAEFLNYDANPLSARATAGFFGRTQASSLKFVPGFRERVAAHLERISKVDRRARLGNRPILVAAE